MTRRQGRTDGEMTRDEWAAAAGFFLAAHGVENFTAAEICLVGRIRGGATLEAPPPEFMRHALKLIGVLEWLRWYQGAAAVHVNSWYRSEAYNAVISVSDKSMHLTAGAADITKDGWPPSRVALALHNDYPMAEQLGIGLYDTRVHVDVRGMLGRRAPARWSGPGVSEWWLESVA